MNEQRIEQANEQLTRESFELPRLMLPDMEGQGIFDYNPTNIEIWDYSLENVKNFNKNGIHNVKHVPFCLWDDYKRRIESYNLNKNYEYDVVFVGWINERRGLILNELKQNGIKVFTIPHHINGNFGEERDKMISKSKILLNIHFKEDYKIFESYRCFPWVETNKIIVSENSLDNDIRCINVNYENIVDTIIKIINDN